MPALQAGPGRKTRPGILPANRQTMPDNIPGGQPVSLCPFTNYLSATADRLLREYADADSLPEKDHALRNALDLARLIQNVIEPIAKSGRPALWQSARATAERLLDLARPWVEKHPAMFPKRPDHTLQFLDVLENVERAIHVLKADVAKLTARRQGQKVKAAA